MKKWVASKLLLFIVALTANQAIGQPMGSWQPHFSFSDLKLVESGGNNVMGAGQNGLFTLNLTTRETKILSKINGLSDQRITAINYRSTTQTWLLGYESGAIDLIVNGKIRSLTLIKNLNQFDDKQINQFLIVGNQAYVATNVGIAVINLASEAVTDIYREIGPNGSPAACLALEEINDSIFAITNLGILSASLSDNLLDFSRWTMLATGDTASFSHPFVLGQAMHFIQNGSTIIRRQGQSWTVVDELSQDIRDVSISGNAAYLLTEGAILRKISGEVPIRTNEGFFTNGQSLKIDNDRVWVADGLQGLVEITANSASNIVPNGPPTDNLRRLKWQNNQLFAFTENIRGLHYFSSGSWRTIETTHDYQITEATFFENRLYIGTRNQGLFDVEENEPLYPVEIKNATINRLIPYQNGLLALFDDNELSLASLFPWENLSGNLGNLSRPIDGVISKGETLWLRFGQQQGFGALALLPETGQTRRITQATGLPAGEITAMAIDENDEAWLATGNGVAFFTDATFIFNSDRAFLPFFEGGELFKDERVTSLLFDGGNRLWVSTGRGIWVFNPNLTEVQFRFTTENSPLPSNQINQMAYASDGTVFILTDRGMVSFRSNSSIGQAVHSQVRIFPNPVSIRSGDQVGISGLASNARVKITTVDGSLIKNLQAYGSTTSWDLTQLSGGRVAVGVYLVFSSTADGVETYAGKFVVVP